MLTVRLLLGALLLCVLSATALAQTRTTPPENPQCPPNGQPPRPGESLGKQLSEGKGVICPPNVDPSMKVPAPPSDSKMPVIPPPGSPGGNEKVQPK